VSAAERIAAKLSPHLGAHSADAVARHLCAKHGIGEGASAQQLGEFKELLRRGLVAFVGAERAASLAEECVREISPGGK
jgi:hypothetical protein